MKYIVALIHNQSLVKVIEVSSIEEGKIVIRGLFVEQFADSLTDTQEDDLEDNHEIYINVDHDNAFTLSIGSVN